MELMEQEAINTEDYGMTGKGGSLGRDKYH